MKKIACLILVFLLFTVTASAQTETSIFKIIKFKTDKLLSFDDNNTLKINGTNVKLVCKEELEGAYTLIVTINNKTVLTKKHIKGVTKVLYDGSYIAFSVFTYSDEDGNNQGYGYVIDTKTNSVKLYPQKLKNTCNPVVIGKAVYFINNLTFFVTDLDMKLQRMIVIDYQNKDKTFLDTYSISGVFAINGNSMVVDFSPDRFKGKSGLYCGVVVDKTQFITLKS